MFAFLPILAACVSLSAQDPVILEPRPNTEPSAPQAQPVDDAKPRSQSLFPPASGDLVLPGMEEGTFTFAELLAEYGRLTGQTFGLSDEDRQVASGTQINMSHPVVVPARDVQRYFEGLLRKHHFALFVLREESPRLLSITSRQQGNRTSMREMARFVQTQELARFSKHPALLISTSVFLPNVDVRQLSNSMRTMIVDANTQQLLPAGNTNGLILTGFADQVYSLYQMLIELNEQAAEEEVRAIVRRFPLKNADAATTAEIITQLLENARPPVINQGQQTPLPFRVVGDARTNALLAVAVPEVMELVEEAVALADIAVD